MHAIRVSRTAAVTVLAAASLLVGLGATAADAGDGGRDAGVRSVAGAALPGDPGRPGAVAADFGWQ